MDGGQGIFHRSPTLRAWMSFVESLQAGWPTLSLPRYWATPWVVSGCILVAFRGELGSGSEAAPFSERVKSYYVSRTCAREGQAPAINAQGRWETER